MEIKDILEELDNTEELDEQSVNDRLTINTGRQYAYTGPATTRITRQDKMKLLRSKDLEQLKATMDKGFEMILAAAKGTTLQQTILQKLNVARRQIFQKLDKEIEKQSKQEQ